MSLAVLSRKSKIKNFSNKDGFSTANITRNIGYIGKEQLFSELKTPFKGAIPRGHGSSNDTYVVTIISNNKTSNTGSMNPRYTSGSLTNKKGNQGRWVKLMSSFEKMQSKYINELKIKTIHCQTEPIYDASDNNIGENCDCTKKYFNIHKNVNTVIPSGEYTNSVLLINKCLPTPPCKQHFPVSLNKHGCDSNYNNPQEAINAGLLPENWMDCNS